MSSKIPTSIENLLAAEHPTARPSIELARMVLKPLLDDVEGDATTFDILEHDSHPNYCPSFDEVLNWAMRSLPEAVRSCDDLDQSLDFEIHDFSTALDEYSAGRISSEQLIEEVAKNFSLIDDAALFGGTAAMKHWHAARISREALRIHNFIGETVDAVFAIPLAELTHALQQLERLQAGREVQGVTVGRHEGLDKVIVDMQNMLRRTPQIVDAALRVGFLYRDAWWIENHGEITIKGYLSQLRATKAGEGGGKQSNNMRMQRIRYFLAEHARLISDNPILRDDPPEDVAYRAIKLAAKKHPELFRRGASKRSAREYWEYILSDQDLRGEYENLIISSTYRKKA